MEETLPEEVRLFDKRHLIVLKEGCRPIRAKKFIYYKSAEWKKRLLPAILLPTLDIFRKA